MGQLNRNEKNNPLYKQIFEYLKKEIEQGKYQTDERILSEQEISTLCDVSRITSRQALKELEKEGYISRVQGKGSYVCWKAPKSRPSCTATSLLKWISRQHEKITLGELTMLPTVPELQEYYNVEKEMLGHVLELKQQNNGYVTYCVYYPYLSQLNLNAYSKTKSIHTIYLEHDSCMMRMVQSVRALVSDEVISRIFHIPENTAVLHSIIAIYDKDNHLLELIVGYHNDANAMITVKSE